MGSIEYGELKMFKSDKGFGFLRVRTHEGFTGEEIFFHLDRFHSVDSHPWLPAPFFVPKTYTPDMQYIRDVVFERGVRGQGNRRRTFCAKWTVSHNWHLRAQLLREFPPCRVVRLQDGKVVDHCWESPIGRQGVQNVLDLMECYPRTGDDELSASYKEDPDGYIWNGLRLEIWVPYKSDYRETWGTTHNLDYGMPQDRHVGVDWYPIYDLRKPPTPVR